MLDKTSDWWYVETKEGDGYIHKSRIKQSTGTDKSPNKALCTYNTISDKYTFSISVIKYSADEKKPVELNISVSEKSKPAMPVNIVFKPEYWIKENCSATSYIGRSTTYEGIEKYNKFIIADYNFDGLEEFAIVTYEGGNGGPRYSFFLQDGEQHFTRSQEFPPSRRVFP